jgi:hypothetical protein
LITNGVPSSVATELYDSSISLGYGFGTGASIVQNDDYSLTIYQVLTGYDQVCGEGNYTNPPVPLCITGLDNYYNAQVQMQYKFVFII